jgi:hypothetical protein
MHGQSDYTPLKQTQLKSLLDACYWAWDKSHSFASPQRYFIDCMAGSGFDEQGNQGSPLILQDYAKQFNSPVIAWCDNDPKFVYSFAWWPLPNRGASIHGGYALQRHGTRLP